MSAVLLIVVSTLSQQPPLYRDATAPVNARVADLLGRMSLNEKVAQVRQIYDIYHHWAPDNFITYLIGLLDNTTVTRAPFPPSGQRPDHVSRASAPRAPVLCTVKWATKRVIIFI